MVADPQGIGDGRQGGVNGPDRRHKARINYIKVVQFMGLAVEIEHGCSRVAAEAAGASLMAHRGDRHLALDIKLALH